MTEQIRNWAGNIRFSAKRVHRPTSLDDLCRVVAEADSVRVLGTGHSFNRIADTPGDLVTLDALPAEITIDTDARAATISAGMRLADISTRLHAAGFALTNLPSLPHISLAGTCATGTHGSGDRNQGLATSVSSLQMVTPDGELAEYSRSDYADFAGLAVGLGALGVVTRMTVDLLPSFTVAQFVYHDVPLDQVIEQRDQLFASAYSVSAFTDWNSGRATVWRKLRVADDIPLEEVKRAWHGGRPAVEPAHPVPGMLATNSTVQLGVPGPWHERLPHFRPEFTPSNGQELQSEFFVARPRAAEALEALRAIGSRIAPVVQIAEIRTIAADDLWLSPCYGRDSLAIHFTWIADRDAVTPVLREVEAALLQLGARTHWGKLFTSGPEAALAGYERSEDFRRLLAHHDPSGTFRNTFIENLFPPH